MSYALRAIHSKYRARMRKEGTSSALTTPGGGERTRWVEYAHPRLSGALSPESRVGRLSGLGVRLFNEGNHPNQPPVELKIKFKNLLLIPDSLI